MNDVSLTITDAPISVTIVEENITLTVTEENITLILDEGTAITAAIESHALQLAILQGAIHGISRTNTGTWNGSTVTLVDVGNRMVIPSGIIYAYDEDTNDWKSIMWLGSWVGDTTYSIRQGTMIRFVGCTQQHFELPWIPNLDQVPKVITVSDIVVDSYSGATGQFTTVDGKTVTVWKGIITNIV